MKLNTWLTPLVVAVVGVVAAGIVVLVVGPKEAPGDVVYEAGGEVASGFYRDEKLDGLGIKSFREPVFTRTFAKKPTVFVTARGSGAYEVWCRITVDGREVAFEKGQTVTCSAGGGSRE